MKCFLSILVIAIGLCCDGYAQAAGGEKPPLPSGSLPRAVPEIAAWTIVYKPGREASAAPSPGGNVAQTDAAKKLPPPRRIEVIRTGQIAKVVETDPDGRSLVRWYWSGKEFNEVEGGRWVVSTGSARMPDFSDFTWVSEKNYVGVETVENVSCYVFQDTVQIAGMDAPLLARAAIGVESRLPVQLLLGSVAGFLEAQTYKFFDPPTTLLAVPEGVSALLAEQIQLGKGLMRRPK